MSLNPRTIPGLLAVHPDGAPALGAPGAIWLDHKGLRAQVEATARALRSHGIGRQHRVAIVMPNGPGMAAAFLGVASAAACAPLNPAYGKADFEFYLDDLGAKALIVERGSQSPAMEVAATRGLAVLELELTPPCGAGTFRLPAGPRPAEDLFNGPEDVALVLHTSGTTSRPKSVPLSHANLCASARHISESLGLTYYDRCLNIMPLFHVHGLVGALLASLQAGSAVVCAPGFLAPRFLEWLSDSGATWYTGVPTMHQAVLSRVPPSGAPGSRLRFIRSCSAALPPTVMADLERMFGVPVVEAYGMTEASHQMSVNPLPPGDRRPGSVGLATGNKVAVMDNAGNLLPAGTTGEIVIRGPNLTDGYENNAEANAAAFTGGWFRTGDQGYLDSDGYIWLTGRLKELINRGGEKISPREIDEALLEHPGVAQAIAFAVPDARLGEDVAAAVVLKPGADASERDLRGFAAGRLVAFKVPRRILLVDEIPKGPTGKPQRIGLAAKLGLDKVAELPPRPPWVAPASEDEKQIAAIFAEVLGIDSPGLHDDFFALGGDSILAVQLASRLEVEFGVDVMPSLIDQPTVERVAATARLRVSSPVVALKTGGARPPLFCLPNVVSSLLGYRNLAGCLDVEQPVYALVPKGIVQGEFRLEDLAARYVQGIKEIQPQGPYYLSGHCFGGLVGYEMARQLSSAGERVALVVMIECYAHGWMPDVSPADRFRARMLWLRGAVRRGAGNFARLHPRNYWRYVREKWRQVAVVHRIEQVRKDPAGAQPRTQDEWNQVAAARYRPGSYQGRVVLLQARDREYPIPPRPLMGWAGKIGDETPCVVIPGGHDAILAEPLVADLAAEIENALDAARIAERDLYPYPSHASRNETAEATG